MESKGFSQIVETERLADQQQTSSPIRYPLSSTLIAYDLLTMITKGIFPDTVPDDERLKNLVENLSDRLDAEPLSPLSPLYKLSRENLYWPGVIEEFATEWKISNKMWKGKSFKKQHLKENGHG